MAPNTPAPPPGQLPLKARMARALQEPMTAEEEEQSRQRLVASRDRVLELEAKKIAEFREMWRQRLLASRGNTALAMLEPLRFVRAHELLGRALEAIGDREGACTAYASVLARWGAAVPSSRTARAAALRSVTLACDAD